MIRNHAGGPKRISCPKFDEEMEDVIEGLNSDDVEMGRQSERCHDDDSGTRRQKRSREPEGEAVTFHNSTVSYGGADGTDYTSSWTRGAGIYGLVFEEYKQADTSTMQAAHGIYKRLNDQGHSLFKNLGSDGRVDTIQTLRNLHEDELPLFDQTWDGSFRKHMLGWREYISNCDGKGLTTETKFIQPIPLEFLWNNRQVGADGSVRLLKSYKTVTIENTALGVVVTEGNLELPPVFCSWSATSKQCRPGCSGN